MKARAAERILKDGCNVMEKAKDAKGPMVDDYASKLRGMLIRLDAIWSRAQSMVRFRRLTEEWIDHDKRVEETIGKYESNKEPNELAFKMFCFKPSELHLSLKH